MKKYSFYKYALTGLPNRGAAGGLAFDPRGKVTGIWSNKDYNRQHSQGGLLL